MQGMKLLVDAEGAVVSIGTEHYKGPLTPHSPPDGFMVEHGPYYRYIEGQWIITDPIIWADVLYLKIHNGYEAAVKRPRVPVTLPRPEGGLEVIVDGGRDDYFNFREECGNLGDLESTAIRDADNNFHHGISKGDLELIYRTIYVHGRNLKHLKWEKDQRVAAALNDPDPLAALAALEQDGVTDYS